MNTFGALRCSLRRWELGCAKLAALIADEERRMAAGGVVVDLEAERLKLHAWSAHGRQLAEYLANPTEDGLQAMIRASAEMTAALEASVRRGRFRLS